MKLTHFKKPRLNNINLLKPNTGDSLPRRY